MASTEGAATDTDADRPADPASGRTLPYDPAEWERRLAEARERRARALAERMAQAGAAAGAPADRSGAAHADAGEAAAGIGPGPLSARLAEVSRALRSGEAEADAPAVAALAARQSASAPAAPETVRQAGEGDVAGACAADDDAADGRLRRLGAALGRAAPAHGTPRPALAAQRRAPEPVVRDAAPAGRTQPRRKLAVAAGFAAGLGLGIAASVAVLLSWPPAPVPSSDTAAAPAPRTGTDLADTAPAGAPAVAAAPLAHALPQAAPGALPAAPAAPRDGTATAGPGVAAAVPGREMLPPVAATTPPATSQARAPAAASTPPSAAAPPPDMPLPPPRPVAEPAPPPLDLPDGLRLYVHVPPRGAAYAPVAVRLDAAGLADWQRVDTSLPISETHLRYYHAEDAAAAEAIAARLNAATRDFTGYTPRPEPGLVEVWLAGRGGSGTAPRPPAPGLGEIARSVSRALSDLVDTFPANERR